MQWSSGGWLLSEKAISDAAKQQCNIAAQLSLLAYDFTYLDQGKKRLRALTEDTGTVHKKGEGKV